MKKNDNEKKLLVQFAEKKKRYQEKIAAWQEKGWTTAYKQGKALLTKAENLALELKEFLAQPYLDIAAITRTSTKLRATLKNLKELTKPVWQQWTEAIVIAALLAFVLRTYVFGLYHVPTGSAERTILVGDRIWGNKMSYFFSEVKRGDLVIFDKPNFRYNRSNSLIYFWQKYIGFPLPFFGLNKAPENWVKRVIGVPGDTVEGQVEDGKTTIFLNGKKLNESYVNPYPLIRLKQEVGFFNIDSLGPFSLPSFLRVQSRLRIYTYDPSKELEDQPFYNMTEKQLVRDLHTGEYMLEHPYTPSYNHAGQSIDAFGPFIVPEGKYWVMGDSRKNSEDSRYWGFLDRSLIHGRASFVIYSVDSEEPFWFFELLKHPINFWYRSVRWSRTGKGLS